MNTNKAFSSHSLHGLKIIFSSLINTKHLRRALMGNQIFLTNSTKLSYLHFKLITTTYPHVCQKYKYAIIKWNEKVLTKDGGQVLLHTGGTNNHAAYCAHGHVWQETKPTGVAPSTETGKRTWEARGGGRRDKQELPAEPGHGHPLSPSADKQSDSVQEEKRFGKHFKPNQVSIDGNMLRSSGLFTVFMLTRNTVYCCGSCQQEALKYLLHYTNQSQQTA